MSRKITVFALNIVLLSLVSCDNNDIKKLYQDFVQMDQVQLKIENNLASLEIDEATLITAKMIDASSKIPSGVIMGNFFDFGHFDECYGIESGEIYGKYCLGTLSGAGLGQLIPHNLTQKRFFLNPTHPQPRMIGSSPDSVGLHFALCIPSSMSAAEVSGIINFSEDLCYSKATEEGLSSGAIATIVVLSIFGYLVVCSTLLDVIFECLGKKPQHELLIAFSFWTNGRKIFKSSTNPDQLLCLNGIKALSMFWVIIGHEYSLAISAPLSNFFSIIDWEKDSANMFLLGATVSVDTFFVVGGLVTVYTFLKAVDKGVKLNIPMFYIHRYLRLTPALAIMILVYLFLLNYMGNGPLWFTIQSDKSCEDGGWWQSLLYVSNYITVGTCVPQSWYLNVDMQLYILSPLILVPLAKWPKKTLILLGFLAVLGCIVPFGIGYGLHLPSQMMSSSSSGDMSDYMMYYYKATYARFGPYVIGMLLGYYVYQIKKGLLRISIPPVGVAVLWLVCLTGLVACVYAGHPLVVATEEDRWGNAMFLAFNRPAWAVALSGVIFLCVSGYGGPIDTFLSLPVFQILTKLSYSMYLVHYPLLTVKYASMKNTIKFSNWAMFHVFWGDFMFTLAISLVLCLTFESPIIILEKYLFGTGKRKPQVQKKPEV